MFSLAGVTRLHFVTVVKVKGRTILKTIFFSARFTTFLSERGTSAWSTEKKPFLSIIFFLIYGANFFLPAQARYPKLCSEGRETAGSPK